jgi:threonine/homoserine/homoserine lactone efflux protein
MGKAIGEILPYAVAASISVSAIVAIILMLVTPKAKTNGTAFAAGYVLGFALVGTIVIVLAGGKDYSSGSGPTQTVSIIKLVLGLLLLVAAVRQWRGRPREGETPKLPKWMGTIDSFTAGKSLAIGVLLSAVNPKNLAMSLAAGLAIAQAAIPTGQEVVVLIIYIVIGASTVLAPVVVYFAMGDRAAAILGGWRKWLEENNAVVTALVLLVLAAVLIGQGITGCRETIRLAASTPAHGTRQSRPQATETWCPRREAAAARRDCVPADDDPVRFWTHLATAVARRIRVERHPNDGPGALDTPRPQQSRLAIHSQPARRPLRGRPRRRHRSSQAGAACVTCPAEPRGDQRGCPGNNRPSDGQRTAPHSPGELVRPLSH